MEIPMKLSIIIPSYNEENFIGPLLEKILGIDLNPVGFEKEIIVIDDGSTDCTKSIAQGYSHVRVLSQSNQGKGKAVQTGIRASTGDWILIQDSDLEYHPEDYIPMLSAISSSNESIYGSRILGQIQKNGWRWFPGKHPHQHVGPWLAGVILSVWTWALYGCWISDTLTGYKLYPAKILKQLILKTHGFETDHEITAKLKKAKITIKEIPIHYSPRTSEEGKKIKAKDGFIAMWTLLKYRFVS